MLAHFAVSLLVILAGFVGMLLLLHFWFGGSEGAPGHEEELDWGSRPEEQATVSDPRETFIPMPDHLKTADEMVAWMTQEMPKLAAGIQKPLG